MKLSIIIPAFNAEKYIQKCIESILAPLNAENDIEIIIVNDGSTDKTHEIINKCKDERIKLFNNTNHGVSYSRNFGINKSTGELLMFVDADDTLEKNWYRVVKRAIPDNEYDVIYFSKKISNSVDTKKMLTYIIGNNEENICLAGPFSKIFRRSFIVNNNIQFNCNLINGEDMLFNVEALLKARKYKIISESFYKYTQILNTATKSFNTKLFETDRMFQKEIDRILNKHCNDISLIGDIKDYCLANGIITIMDRLSYLDNYKKVRKYLTILKDEPYNRIPIMVKRLSIIKKIILILIKAKFYYLTYKVFKIRNKLKYSEKKSSDIKIIYI